MALCAEHAAELELCSSVYPELTHVENGDASTTLSLPLAGEGASCTLHVRLPPCAAAPPQPSLSRVRGWLDEGALAAALAAAAPAATPLELCMLAAEHVAAVQAPCAVCLQPVAGEAALVGPCQHPLHRHCGACHAHTLVEARRASPEHAAGKAARAALAAAALGRVRVAEGAADFAQAALEACLARAAGLRAQVEAAAAGSGGSGGGGAPKRALPPSKARRFEAAEEAAAAQALPLPVQLERALAEAEGLRAEAASAQARLAAARRGDGSGSGSGGGSSSGSGSGSPAASEAEEAALQEHLAIAADLVLPCPVCRLPIQVPGYAAWARARHVAAAAAGTAVAALPEPREPPEPLPRAVSQGIAELERRFKTLWQRQEARGGIIEAEARRW